MRPPRRVSPAAAARRSLLVDVLLGAALAIAAIVVAAGIGVVGFFALLGALVVLAWYLAEGALRRVGRARRSPRPGRGRRPSPPAGSPARRRR